MLEPSIKKAAVIGYPVKHSLSPRLHGFWLKEYGIAGEYTAIEIAPEKLREFISTMGENGFCGLNLTIPHKESVIPMLHEVDETAQAIGAVNCVVVRDRKLFGTNTDAYGFAENIRPFINGKRKAVVLGAGGAAKAVVFALAGLGFDEIIITNRTRERAESLVSLASDKVKVADWEVRSKILENADLLVNTTSLGLKNNPPLEIDLSLLPKTALVTDIVYSPLLTPLLEMAKARGNKIVDGLGMLLHQAAPAFEAWFGVRPEVKDELREYVLAK